MYLGVKASVSTFLSLLHIFNKRFPTVTFKGSIQPQPVTEILHDKCVYVPTLLTIQYMRGFCQVAIICMVFY